MTDSMDPKNYNKISYGQDADYILDESEPSRLLPCLVLLRGIGWKNCTVIHFSGRSRRHESTLLRRRKAQLCR